MVAVDSKDAENEVSTKVPSSTIKKDQPKEDLRALARELRRAKRKLFLKQVEDQPSALNLLQTRLLSLSVSQRSTGTFDEELSLSSTEGSAVCVFRAPSRAVSSESI